MIYKNRVTKKSHTVGNKQLETGYDFCHKIGVQIFNEEYPEGASHQDVFDTIQYNINHGMTVDIIPSNIRHMFE